jgi:transposase
LYRAFERRLSPTMRQTHVAADKVFVDHSGKKVPIVDLLTGEVRMAELLVAVLGAFNFTYVDATWTQSLPGWIGPSSGIPPASQAEPWPASPMCGCSGSSIRHRHS